MIQINRWLRQPGGSAYRIPDIRIPGEDLIIDGTIAMKTMDKLQVQGFFYFSRGDRILIVRPTQMGGAYELGPSYGSFLKGE